MIKDVLDNVVTSLNDTADQVYDKAPHIMIFAGVLSMAGAAIWASVKAYKELPYAIDDLNDNEMYLQEEYQEEYETKNLYYSDMYQDPQFRKDMRKLYAKHFARCVKIFAGPGFAFVAGAALVFGGEYIIIERAAKELAEITAVAEMYAMAYKTLASHVDENFGEGTADKLMSGGELKKKPKIEDKDWEFMNPPDGLYVFTFDQSNPEWDDDMTRELLYDKLSMMQNALNDRMVSRFRSGVNGVTDRPGYLWLYEACDALSLEPDVEGKVDLANNAGWIFDPNNPVGDGYIDFGLDAPINQRFFFKEGTDPKDRIFNTNPIRGAHGTILKEDSFDHNDVIFLNFNCDGLIGPKLNPNSRFRLELRTKGVSQSDF